MDYPVKPDNDKPLERSSIANDPVENNYLTFLHKILNKTKKGGHEPAFDCSIILFFPLGYCDAG